jgi:SAM-dependent methyltransferase
MIRFRCNICGRKTSFPQEHLLREQWSCVNCGSSVRWRSIIHALSIELFGRSLAICDFPIRKDIRGLGMSDWVTYAKRLEEKFSYTNTFYHMDPFLDITHIDDSQHGLYDFIISSDVFEHICPPVSTAFENARLLLKPGGVLILTVPYVEGETLEHFPDTRSFSVYRKMGQWVLLSKSADGRSMEFTDLTFHGGPGTTLEFRIFGKDSLARDCASAGFRHIRIHDESLEDFGISWLTNSDGAPWALVNEG